MYQFLVDVKYVMHVYIMCFVDLITFCVLKQQYLLCLLVAQGSHVRDFLCMFSRDYHDLSNMTTQRSAQLKFDTAWHRLSISISD